MTHAQSLARTPDPTPASAPYSHALQPMRAWRGFRRLVADKEDTEQVFEIMRALSGRSISKGYAQLLETPQGARQAWLRIELADRLHDGEWLASLPDGSVGAAYRDFIAARSLSAHGLAAESRKIADVDIDAPNPVTWYARRVRDVHDIWHVLTGYGTDALGEACVVAFSYSQTRNAGFALIAGGAALEFERLRKGQPYAQAIWQAWRRGAKAAWLPALDYEALFGQPLEAARARLRITAPTAYDAIPVEARNGFRFDH